MKKEILLNYSTKEYNRYTYTGRRQLMTISFFEFISQLMDNLPLLITVILTLGVILVNGWTDAPNAIATCVSTRAIGPRAAIFMATIFNFLGVFFMTMINANVAQTIYNMVDFGGDPHNAISA